MEIVAVLVLQIQFLHTEKLIYFSRHRERNVIERIIFLFVLKLSRILLCYRIVLFCSRKVSTVMLCSFWRAAEMAFLCGRQSLRCDSCFARVLYACIYVAANLWNQLIPGISNSFRESGESLKWISSKLGILDLVT